MAKIKLITSYSRNVIRPLCFENDNNFAPIINQLIDLLKIRAIAQSQSEKRCI